MKVTVVLDAAGKVIAAHVPVAAESGPDSQVENQVTTGFMASEGQKVQDLDVPDVDVPGGPPDDFLEFLQRLIDEPPRTTSD